MDLGFSEVLFILLLALLLFGPRKLPEISRQIGRGLAEFRASICTGPKLQVPREFVLPSSVLRRNSLLSRSCLPHEDINDPRCNSRFVNPLVGLIASGQRLVCRNRCEASTGVDFPV